MSARETDTFFEKHYHIVYPQCRYDRDGRPLRSNEIVQIARRDHRPASNPRKKSLNQRERHIALVTNRQNTGFERPGRGRRRGTTEISTFTWVLPRSGSIHVPEDVDLFGRHRFSRLT